MKTILILLDTLRKDICTHSNSEYVCNTPNIDKIAKTSYCYNNHYVGSLPCMPARRDIFTGRLDFFEKAWGGLEPYDKTFVNVLNENNIKTSIITDHHHYFKYGGEGYVQQFTNWHFERGQESDFFDDCTIKSDKEVHGRNNIQFLKNSRAFNRYSDYPTYKTFLNACDYIEKNKDESYFLMVEGFDPHEPFFVPKEYLEKQGISSNINGKSYISPQYGQLQDNQEELEYIFRRYLANVEFADAAVGELLNKLEELGQFNEVNIILTTDHGFHLGEHNVLGKGITHPYNELAQIPLFIKKAGNTHQSIINNLTQSIDLFPTICSIFNLDIDERVQGINLFSDSKRDSLVYGYFGQSVGITDGEYTLFQGIEKTEDLYHYSASLTKRKGYHVNFSEIETGHFLKHTQCPVYKVPISYNKLENSSVIIDEIFTSECYRNEDITQGKVIESLEINNMLKTKLVEQMINLEVPVEQFSRLGLKYLLSK